MAKKGMQVRFVAHMSARRLLHGEEVEVIGLLRGEDRDDVGVVEGGERGGHLDWSVRRAPPHAWDADGWTLAAGHGLVTKQREELEATNTSQEPVS